MIRVRCQLRRSTLPKLRRRRPTFRQGRERRSFSDSSTDGVRSSWFLLTWRGVRPVSNTRACLSACPLRSVAARDATKPARPAQWTPHMRTRTVTLRAPNGDICGTRRGGAPAPDRVSGGASDWSITPVVDSDPRPIRLAYAVPARRPGLALPDPSATGRRGAPPALRTTARDVRDQQCGRAAFSVRRSKRGRGGSEARTSEGELDVMGVAAFLDRYRVPGSFLEQLEPRRRRGRLEPLI